MQYVAASLLLASADSDLATTREERWILHQLSGLDDDKHPNMHACRVRLAMAMKFSASANVSIPWNLATEFHAYKGKVCAVGAHIQTRPSLRARARVA